MNRSTLFAAILFMAGSFSVHAQVTTDPVGFSQVNATPGTTLVVPTLCNAAVFSGQATISSDGLTISPLSAPGWTANAYGPTAFSGGTPNYPRYYAEVTTGAYEGLGFDVLGNSVASLTIGVGEVPEPLKGQTVQFALRKHVTLDQLISSATGLTAYADAVSIFNSNGTQSIRYYDGSSWVADDYSTPAGHTIIYPGTGFACSVTSTATWTFVGNVKSTKTMVNLYAGSTNIVGPVDPAAVSLLYGNSIAASMAPYADGFNTFSTNGQMQITGTYYSDGSSVLDSTYTPLASNAMDAIPVNRGFVVSVTTDTVWTVKSPLSP